jgi:hypothetical protein
MAAALAGILCVSANAAPRKHVVADGNRTRAVHHIPLYDENLIEIRPDDYLAMPFSTKMTCGDCHDYEKIGMGWHFDSSLNLTRPGRPGEPWVLADENTGTQLPLSYRGWPGAWRPDDIGMTPWQFVQFFGRQMPGGDAGEKEEETPDPQSRWNVSGRVEINCLACHNASAEQNQSEWAIQMARENYRWAATGAGAIGVVENMASRLPDYYDLIDGPNRDNAWAAVPYVVYDTSRFNGKNFVFFDVTRNPPPNRCYYCHSTVPRNVDTEKVWPWDTDVHISAGLICTDCHRNGLDHFVVRGYEGERSDPAYAMLTCRGCHLGDPANPAFEARGGRMMAPRPLHRGLPAVHLDKLTCTACHAGYLPGDKTEVVRTARANRLGIHGRARWDMEIPYIQSPVFVRLDDGRIEPREIMWPAFWGRIKGDKVTPLPLDRVTPAVDAVREADRLAAREMERQKTEAGLPAEPEKAKEQPQTGSGAAGEADTSESRPRENAEKPAGEGSAETKTGDESESKPAAEATPAIPEEIKPLTEQQVVKVLAALAAEPGSEGDPVYVSGGKLYRLGLGGKGLAVSDHPAAQPYSWPFAHDVRPAGQSLGARGCTDCHDEDSNFFFGQVAALSPTPVGAPASVRMYEMEHLDPKFLAALDEGVEWRLPFIAGGLITAVLLLAALIHYGYIGLEGFLRLLVAAGAKK